MTRPDWPWNCRGALSLRKSGSARGRSDHADDFNPGFAGPTHPAISKVPAFGRVFPMGARWKPRAEHAHAGHRAGP